MLLLLSSLLCQWPFFSRAYLRLFLILRDNGGIFDLGGEGCRHRHGLMNRLPLLFWHMLDRGNAGVWRDGARRIGQRRIVATCWQRLMAPMRKYQLLLLIVAS